MEHIILFNKIFNGRGALGKYAQTVAIMLARKYFYLNPTFEEYGIEDMTSESDFEVERHLAKRKTQGPQFIIPPGYITTNTTSKVSLNNTSSCPLPSGQLARSRTTLRPGQSISRKRTTVMDVDGDTTMAGSETKKKAEKLKGGEQIASEISKWTLQNMVSLEACCSERMKLEAKVIVDIKICYSNAFENLNLAKFGALIHALKANNEDYKRSMIAEYYFMLGVGTLQDLFKEALE